MDFLEKVAIKLYENHRDAMEKQVVVLPSRRAGLYLTKYLSRLSERPQWAPGMMTVTDLFASMTDLRPAGVETLIFELYSTYRRHVKEALPFDDFWNWGETIINDFNDIDLCMADAEKVYGNISDLKEIDEKFGSLDEKQVQIIRRFWVSFNPATSDSAARSRFISVWKLLGPLYTDFTMALRAKGIAGVGMMCRDVASRASAGNLQIDDSKTYHIAGLNALNECEKQLFRFLKENGRARFYWDDDHSFMKEPDHKAGVFIRENLKIFRNEIDSRNGQNTEIRAGRWTIIDTPSDTAQAKLLTRILGEAGVSGNDDLTDTAIVLADEKLLMPVLNSLPKDIEEVNVTMGHPFRFTPLYSFLRQLAIIARSARRQGEKISFRSDDILVLLRHQYLMLLEGEAAGNLASDLIYANMIRVEKAFLSLKLSTDILFDLPAEGSDLPGHLIRVLEAVEERTFAVPEKNSGMNVDREYIRLALSEIGRLQNLIGEHGLNLKMETCIRLIDRVMKKLVVPFSGEPLKGLQVMGVLETRALEFRNIVFLSLNEGIFPQQGYDNTFIPYNIRRAFGLPTINEHESVYSYHFFRLLRKPRHAWFLYNSTSQGLNTGEMSRYLIQMKYDPAFRPEMRSMNITVGRSKNIPEIREKEVLHVNLLRERYGAGKEDGDYLSPSAINTWMNCRMKFYYSYVCGLPEEEKLEKDIDQRRFGNILHDVMESLYEPLKNEKNLLLKIKALSGDNDKIRGSIISTAAREMRWPEENLLVGKSIIIIDVLERYVKDILAYDGSFKSLELLGLEEKLSGEIGIDCGGEKILINIGGRADRIDRTDGTLHVVDYKTGSPKKEIEAVEDLFDGTKDRKGDALLQTMIYCSILSARYPGEVILPSIYWVQKISSPEFNPSGYLKELTDADRSKWEDVSGRFTAGLRKSLGDIFSPGEHFSMTEFVNRCISCPFRRLCRR